MCGRAAQTRRAVREAENLLLGASSTATTAAASRTSSHHRHDDESEQQQQQDNYNMSPGMSCTVFYRNDNNAKIQMDRKVWGLVPTGGTTNKPLPTGMTLHFSNSMFNARSDTLLDKRSFAPLFQQGRTCIVVVEGFFEWKPATLKGSKKQPYYVYRNKHAARQCLMFAGLWTRVATGRESDSLLDTFAIITTEACPDLEWLHPRMPLAIYNEDLARLWLEKPSREVFKQMDQAVAPPEYFQWHQVTTEMNSIKFRSPDAIKAVKPPRSVKSFFAPKDTTSTSVKASSNDKSALSSPVKRRAESTASSSPSSPAKKAKQSGAVKKGPIESFFSPKQKK